MDNIQTINITDKASINKKQFGYFMDLLKYAINVYKSNWRFWAVLGMMPVILQVSAENIRIVRENGLVSDFTVIMELVLMLGSIVIGLLSSISILESTKDPFKNRNPKDAIDSLNQSTNTFWSITWLSILGILIIMLGLIFFIIPGVLMAFMLSFSIFALVLSNKKGFEAILSSFLIIRRNFFELLIIFIFGYIALFLFYFIISLIVSVICGILSVSSKYIVDYFSLVVEGFFVWPVVYIFLAKLYGEIISLPTNEVIANPKKEFFKFMSYACFAGLVIGVVLVLISLIFTIK